MKEVEEIRSYLTEDEKLILSRYQQMTDGELLELVRQKAEELDRLPVKADMELAWYFKSRFGPWPRILEAAGLKPLSERHLQRQEKNRQKHLNMRKRTAERRAQKRQSER